MRVLAALPATAAETARVAPESEPAEGGEARLLGSPGLPRLRGHHQRRPPARLELVLLTVPACPNTAVFEERLAAALAGYPDALVRRREVADDQEATRAGMRGSPTLLVNGIDPFAAPGQAPGLSCRIFRDAAGRPAPAPTVEALRRALDQAGAPG